MEKMEILTNLQSEACLLPYQKASVLECLAQMELGKHPSSAWYSNITYYFKLLTKFRLHYAFLSDIFFPADDWACSPNIWHCLYTRNGYKD